MDACAPSGNPDPSAPMSVSRHWPLALAVLLLAGLWSGPLVELSSVSFTAHMALHLALVLVAAPLLALGLARAGVLRGVRFGPGLALVFSLIEMLAVWSWHAPALHAAAALRPGPFALQQASFLGAGVLVWIPGMADRSRAGAASGTLAMAASFTHMSMLGVLLAVAPGLIYAPGLCGGAFGLDALTDQRLGGALMAIVGGLAYLAAALWFAARLLGGTTDGRSRPVAD